MSHGPPELPFVSVVVPVRNGERTIRQCLDSVLANSYPMHRREIVVVDNGSSDDTAAIVRRMPVRCVNEPSPGAANARNRGILESSGEIVAFIDADCVASKGWLAGLVQEFTSPGVAGVAGEIVAYPPQTAAERYMADTHPNWQQRALNGRWPFAATANVAFRRSTFERVGLFDPRLVTGEDKDLGWRVIREAGLEIRYGRRAVVFHRHHTGAWAFVRQHLGWSYGNALLHAKYGLPWRARDELGKYAELAGSLGALASALLWYAVGRATKADVQYAGYDVLRKASYRAGALRWLVAGRALRAKFAGQRMEEESAVG